MPASRTDRPWYEQALDPGGLIFTPETEEAEGTSASPLAGILNSNNSLAPNIAGTESVGNSAGLFSNPTNERPVTGWVTNPITGVPQPTFGATLRENVASGYAAPDRAAPQTQAAQADRNVVRDVQGVQVNTGFLAPGMAAVGAGLGAAGIGFQAAGEGLGQANQTRNEQASNYNRLSMAADGYLPSVAQNQLRQGLQESLQQNLALAASSRGSGSSSVLAQRSAIDANAGLAARTNAQAAGLRAGEMAQSRGELSNFLGNVRGQDLQTAGLGLQGAQVGNSVAQTGVSLAGVGAGLAQTQAQIQQQAQISNQGADLSITQGNAQLQQGANLANLSAQLTQQGLNDQQREMYLGNLLGIDTRTQQGQQALAGLMVNAELQTQATNAGIGMSNTAASQNQSNGIIAAGASLFGM